MKINKQNIIFVAHKYTANLIERFLIIISNLYFCKKQILDMKNNILLCLFGLFGLLMSCGGSGGTAPVANANSNNAAGTDASGFEISDYTNASDFQLAKSYYKNNGAIESEGPLYNDMKEGAWLTYHSGRDSNKIKSITNYHKDLKTGVEIEFATNGSLNKRIDYDGGVLDGIYAEYKYNRPLKYAEYTNGKLNGTYKTFYTNGKVQQMTEYKMDKKDGNSLFYNEEGQVIMEYVYKNDEKVSGGKVTPPPTSQPQ
jgi:antitoxin component YwqK of YwqJK toxin-antitoxin module